MKFAGLSIGTNRDLIPEGQMITVGQIDVRDLRCVVSLAETPNFTVTAQYLHMT